MRILTGDECGLLKECIPELSRPKQREEDKHSNHIQPSTQDGVSRVDPDERQSRARGVVDMTFTSPSSSDGTLSFATLRANGSVELWEGSCPAKKEAFTKYRRVAQSHNVFLDEEDESTNDATSTEQPWKGRPMALGSLHTANRLCAVDSIGRVSVLKADSASVVTTYTAFASTKAQTISYTKGQFINKHIATAMAVDAKGGRVAIGGRERETTLLDLESGKVVWKAKNLPPDPQTLLQQPVWSTALQFLDATASFEGSDHIMAAGTAYRQVRLYDVRTDSKVRRPVSYTPEGVLSHRVTALCQVNSHQLVVGDSAGFLHSLDLRTLGRKRKGVASNLGRFVGPSGSIRQVVKHETLPIVATVGFDRMLRTYNTIKRKQLDCVYLKQRLHCLLFCNDGTWSQEADGSKDDVTEENMEEDDGDIDAEDRVQDYMDSDDEAGGDSSSDDSSDEEVDIDKESENEDDVGVEDDSDDDSQDSDDEEEEVIPTPKQGSKKRRS